MADMLDRLFDEAQEYSGYNTDRDEFEAIVDVIKPMIEAQERERLATLFEQGVLAEGNAIADVAVVIRSQVKP